MLTGCLGSFTAVIFFYQFFSTFYFTFVWVMFGMSVAVMKLLRNRNFLLNGKNG